MKFRDLRADEIEVRVGAISKQGKGLSLLLYKDARCDMIILDETVGVDSWQRNHYECKGNLFCSVGVNTPDNGWVWKDDCGSESNTEKEKGEASDSFKRACVNWGIGRELYTAPFIWVSSSDCNIESNKCKDNFVVQSIVIQNKKITDLVIYNTTKRVVAYSMKGTKTSGKDEPPKQGTSVVRCPKCGKVIEPMKTRNNATWTPERILEFYGMCKDCFVNGKGNNDSNS